MKRDGILIASLFSLALVTASCEGRDNSIPGWPWTDPVEEPEPEPDPEPVFTEANPAIVELGWENLKDSYGELPEGINVYKSPATLQDRKAVAFIAVADLSKAAWNVWSVKCNEYATEEEFKTPSQIYEAQEKPAILINGGYFYSWEGNYSSSLAVISGELYNPNINYASQDWVKVYNPTVGAFVQHADGSFEACWTYYTWDKKHYMYSEPAPNSYDKDPCDTPSESYPSEARTFEAVTAIGGGPVLLRGGEIKNSYVEEMLDISADSAQPRTAIGITADKKLIFFVCEGREMTEGIAGMTTEDVAKVMKSLGCVDAMNLDGGGSSCMLINGQETIKGTDGAQRAVASAVVMK